MNTKQDKHKEKHIGVLNIQVANTHVLTADHGACTRVAWSWSQ